MEVFLQPAEYKRRIRSLDAGAEPAQDQGDPTVTFRGERRSNQTHGSTTDPDAKLANKGNGTAAMVGFTVNGLMENRHRLLLGITVESCRGPASEMDGGRTLIERFHATHDRRIQTVGADKGYFATPFLTALFRRRIRPHIAAKTTGREAVHQRVRRLSRTVGYCLSQRARKKIEELGGGELLARLPALPAAGAAPGPRRSLFDGMAAQLETAGHCAPGSGIGGPSKKGLRDKGKPRRERAQRPSRRGRPFNKERSQTRPPKRTGSNSSFVNTLLGVPCAEHSAQRQTSPALVRPSKIVIR